MPPPYRGGVTVTVHRPGGVDRFGDRQPSATHTITGCALAPRTTTENNSRGDTVIVGLTLYAPFDSDLTATDVVELSSGSKYEVVGEPGRWASPHTARRVGLEVALQRVTG